MEYDEQALEACTHDQHLRLEMAYTSFTVISVYPFSQPFFFFNSLYNFWAGWRGFFWWFFGGFFGIHGIICWWSSPSGKISPNLLEWESRAQKTVTPYPTLPYSLMKNSF